MREQKRQTLLDSYAARAKELERHAHPLDPLSPAELERAVELVRAHKSFRYGMRFAAVMLVEPTKQQLARAAKRRPRKVDVQLIDCEQRCGFATQVELNKGTVKPFRRIDGLQPAIFTEEFIEVELESKLDGRVQEALRRRGLDIQERTQVNVDPWSPGHFGGAEESERRVARGLFYLRAENDDNAYAHPIDGMATLVDLNDKEVIAVEDEEVLPVPRQSYNYAARFRDEWREDLKPLEITQPEGPSFTVEGWKVSWQKWSFRVGFNQREGLTLHQVAYDDEGEERPILYRASVAEMTVPYGDVSFTQRRKNAFDAGEYGLGAQANSLERGCDCLGEIYYFDSACVNGFGDLEPKNNVVCLHEEDAGILWKHWDLRTDKTEVRRSRRLVLSFITTIGNYEYGFYWYFYQDGSIEFEVKATGIVQTGALRDGETSKYGATLGDNLYAPHHQHFFCIRLDPTIDGFANQVSEVETVADPTGESNPYGNAFYPRKHTFASESEAQRLIDPLAARGWLIESSDKENALGGRPAFKLVAGENCLPFAQPDAAIAKRAGYMWKHLWVTRFDPDERYPAGEFPNQHPGEDGLPKWTEADRPIEGEDIVVWYVMGHHHIVRPEDWPVMPVARLGFALKPNGFFTSNPALDVPPPESHCDSDCCAPGSWEDNEGRGRSNGRSEQSEHE